MKRYLALAALILTLAFTAAFPATLGYQIDMLLSQVRTAAGGAITNGHVHFYEPGGTTNKAVWTTVNKGTQAANPFNLDSNGTAYVFGDGLYRIVIHSAPDVTSPLGAVTHGPTVYDRDYIRYEDYGSAVARFTSLAGDNTGTLSGFKTITGPGTGNISGFVNGTFTGAVSAATLAVSSTSVFTGVVTFTAAPVFTDNTINGADLLDNTVALGKIASSGTKDNTTFLRGDGEWSNISDNGSFTGTLTGCVANDNETFYYTKTGSTVVMAIPSTACVSNDPNTTITGLPASLIPARDVFVVSPTSDNSVTILSLIQIKKTTGVMTVRSSITSSTFIASGTKGAGPATVTYQLD